MSTPSVPTTLDYARPGDDQSILKLLELLLRTRRRMARVAVALGCATAVIGVGGLFVVPGEVRQAGVIAEGPAAGLLIAWVASGVALMLIRENRRALASDFMMVVIAIVAVLIALPYALVVACMLLLAGVTQRWVPLVIAAGATPFLLAGSLVFVLAMQCHRLMRLRQHGTVGR